MTKYFLWFSLTCCILFLTKIYMKKAVTIQAIAAALNLSRNTVSKALNGQYVPDKTRELVLKKAKELNYKSFNSETLKSNKYHILLLSGKPFHNMEFFIPVVKSIETYCFRHDYDFYQYTYVPKNDSFSFMNKNIKAFKVDGIVAIESFKPDLIKNILSLNIPVCFLDFPGFKIETNHKYDLICSSDQKTVCDYIKSLIDKYDLNRFTFVGDYRHCLTFHERYMGMLRGLSRTDKDHSKEEDILDDDNKFDYGDVELLKNRIASFKYLPECFVCCNDFVARNVVRAIQGLGFKIPEDTMVIGFDDVNIAVCEHPTLTTFEVDKSFLGQEAIRLLISRIENKNCPTRTTTIDCKLVKRESTKN